MIALKSCPVCNSSAITRYHEVGLAPQIVHAIMPGVKVNAAILTHYFVCQNCHVIFQNPRMREEELDKFYKNSYYRRSINLTDDQISQDETYRAGIDAEIVKRLIGKVSSHLDIGSSRGFFLEKVGADLKVGVEPNVEDNRVKDVVVYRELNQVPDKSFDLVSVIHTLEHVPDPKSLLKEMVRMMNKNSHLVIEVPTWKSPGGPLRLPHLFHFEPDVLRLLCREVGLRVVETKFTPHLLLICKRG